MEPAKRNQFCRRKHHDTAFKNCSFESCSLVHECQSSIRSQSARVDIEIPPPEEVFVNVVKPQCNGDVFPLLNLSALNRLGLNRYTRTVYENWWNSMEKMKLN